MAQAQKIKRDCPFEQARREHARRHAQGIHYQLSNSDCHRLRNCLRSPSAVHIQLQQGQLIRVVTGDPDRKGNRPVAIFDPDRKGNRPVAIFDHTRFDKPCVYRGETLPDAHYLPACQALEQWFGQGEQAA